MKIQAVNFNYLNFFENKETKNNKPFLKGALPYDTVSFGANQDSQKPKRRPRISKSYIQKYIDNVPKEINDMAKPMVLDNFDADKYAKVLTHFVFRDGPIEDMHHSGKPLSDEDIKTLNKFMVNRFAGFLQLLCDEEWYKLKTLVDIYGTYGSEWDKAEPDIEPIDLKIRYTLEQ